MEQDKIAQDKGSTGLQWMMVLLLITALSAGAGLLSGMHLLSLVQRIVDSRKDVPEPRPVTTVFNPNARLRKIAPLVTNLAAPAGTWIRVEGSVVTEELTEEEAAILVARIGEDMVAYLRTITAAQIEGARGLQYLREDLNERAKLRSGGKVRELIIETLVVQ